MPIDNLFGTTVNLLGKTVDLRAKNQNHLSANVANVETPGYQPRTLSFEDELRGALTNEKKGSSPSVTHPRHIPLKGGAARLEDVQGRVVETPSGTGGRDGNGVELETEMGKLVENQIMYNASVQLLAKKFEGLKSVIKGGN